MGINIFFDPPRDFAPNLSVAGCYCLFEDRFLLVKRHPLCCSGGTWCLPGGKVEKGETLMEGARREFHEEVGVLLGENDLSYSTTFYFDRGDMQYDFTVYHHTFKAKPVLQLHLEEHTEAKWVTHEEAEELPLISGGLEIFRQLKDLF